MILQKTYHKLQEWIIMLNSPDFAGTDAELVRKEIMEFCGEIWINRDQDKLNENHAQLLTKVAEQLLSIMEQNNMLLSHNLELMKELDEVRKNGTKRD